ncbi:hypothetical protein M011DRAFT_454397 [Sporormia fimetaria CBS 119925]|uniref:Mitochondrial chaperone BCS1-like ATPase lid domain-containing protein n=1 Tax=Sporormia fimetaria CBS 119925 TaxID=1340428 RepID=A0A6A6UWB7_9PLEO|nr:hypothetical protein M011DRAFT_454397 [Sporormia fimetaria CBS 119925]
MTTNHIERLDPALIRPGRVDMKLELYLADEDMINQLFHFDCELLHLGQEFVAKVPKLEFSPAEILSLLVANKHSPRHAIANVVAWMEKLKDEKTKLTRITSWALDDNDRFGDH